MAPVPVGPPAPAVIDRLLARLGLRRGGASRVGIGGSEHPSQLITGGGKNLLDLTTSQARRGSFLTVALAGPLDGLAFATAVAPRVPAPAVTGTDLSWRTVRGGYRARHDVPVPGVGRGTMSVVVPVSAVGGVVLPGPCTGQ